MKVHQNAQEKLAEVNYTPSGLKLGLGVGVGVRAGVGIYVLGLGC